MDEISQELLLIEEKLEALRQKTAELLERKQTLLTSASSPALFHMNPEPLSPQQKINLFIDLFRGRDDIYALRWENKQGRNGYSVACANEWHQGICNKPKIKCGDCPNQAFLSIDTQALIATGKFIGEGFDLPKLDTLFLALPISWKGSLAQYVGRIHRQAVGKTRALVYDYVDDSLPMLRRMFQRRQKGYDALGYTVTESSQGDGLVQAPLDLTAGA